MATLTIKRATIYTATLTITNDVTGAAYDLTGKTVFFTVKKTVSPSDTTDATYVIKKDITVHSAPTLGQTTLSLTAAETNVTAGNYIWDCKVFVAGTNLNTDSGNCVIEGTVTKRVA
jgi:hypothetical protein